MEKFPGASSSSGKEAQGYEPQIPTRLVAREGNEDQEKLWGISKKTTIEITTNGTATIRTKKEGDPSDNDDEEEESFLFGGLIASVSSRLFTVGIKNLRRCEWGDGDWKDSLLAF